MGSIPQIITDAVEAVYDLFGVVEGSRPPRRKSGISDEWGGWAYSYMGERDLSPDSAYAVYLLEYRMAFWASIDRYDPDGLAHSAAYCSAAAAFRYAQGHEGLAIEYAKAAMELVSQCGGGM